MRYAVISLLVMVLMTTVAVGATISIQPSILTVSAGETFSLNIDAASIADLYAFQFDVGFSPGVLMAVAVTEGAFLPRGGGTTFIPGGIDNVGGTISSTADTLNGLVPGVSGSGTLAILQFTALAPGISPIALSNIILLDSNLSDISVSVAGGTVTVASGVPEPGTAVLLIAGLMCIFCLRFGRAAAGTCR
jgi:Cohesin domain